MTRESDAQFRWPGIGIVTITDDHNAVFELRPNGSWPGVVDEFEFVLSGGKSLLAVEKDGKRLATGGRTSKQVK